MRTGLWLTIVLAASSLTDSWCASASQGQRARCAKLLAALRAKFKKFESTVVVMPNQPMGMTYLANNQPVPVDKILSFLPDEQQLRQLADLLNAQYPGFMVTEQYDNEKVGDEETIKSVKEFICQVMIQHFWAKITVFQTKMKGK